MWNVTPDNLLAARETVAKASDYGVIGTKRFGDRNGANLCVIFARVYRSELNGLAAAVVLEKNPLLLRPNVQVAVVLVRDTEDEVKSNLNRLPVSGDFSTGDFTRAETLRQCFGNQSVKFAIDIAENEDPVDQSGWLLTTVGAANADLFSSVFPHTVLLRGITAQQEKTGSRPFGTILGCSGFESLTWGIKKRNGMRAALRSVFGPLADLGWLADKVRVSERERTQEVYDAIDIVQVPNRSKRYALDLDYMKPFSFAHQGEILGSSDDADDVVMPCDGHLVLGNPEPSGNDPFYYVVQHIDTRTDLIKIPSGL